MLVGGYLWRLEIEKTIKRTRFATFCDRSYLS